MIFGTDTARYQQDGTYDPGDFEIVNVEDPQFEQKTARNLRDGRPTGAYVWIYPGTNVYAFTVWAARKARAAGINFGVWADYEQDGVTLDLLHQFFSACDELGETSGYYGNDWRFGHDAFADRPYWYCGYPDPNDGAWRTYYTPRASRPVQLFQFTSGGGLDRNVVWDESWFRSWGGSAPVPDPVPVPRPILEEDAMLYRATSDGSARVKTNTLVLTDGLSVVTVDSVNSVHGVGFAELPGPTVEAIWADKDRSRGYPAAR